MESRSLLTTVMPSVAAATAAELGSASGFGGRTFGRLTRPSTLRNLTYLSDTGAAHRLDLYLPTGQAPAGGWPVVLAIHGGGWRRFSKEQYGPRAAVLTRAGFAVVAPDYTLSARGLPSWPDALRDLKGSVRWVEALGPRYGLDPDHVAAMGESAGGHLALLLGTTPDLRASVGLPSARVDAVVSFYGPTDLARLSLTSPAAAPAITQLLGSSPGFNPGVALSASPSNWVSPDDPPVLLFHGTGDTLVPLDQALTFASRLTAARVPHLLTTVPAGHGFGFQVGRQDLLTETIGFLTLAFRAPSRS